MSDLNIFPEKIIKTRDSNGNRYRSEVYSLESWGNLSLLKIAFIFILCVFLGPAISAILLFFYCITRSDYENQRRLNIFSLLLSVYILLDIHFNFLFTLLISAIYSKEELLTTKYFNLGMVITNLILLFYSEKIYIFSKKKNLILLAYVIIISTFAFIISKVLITNNIIKI